MSQMSDRPRINLGMLTADQKQMVCVECSCSCCYYYYYYYYYYHYYYH